jgi:hypothetical protein
VTKSCGTYAAGQDIELGHRLRLRSRTQDSGKRKCPSGQSIYHAPTSTTKLSRRLHLASSTGSGETSNEGGAVRTDDSADIRSDLHEREGAHDEPRSSYSVNTSQNKLGANGQLQSIRGRRENERQNVNQSMRAGKFRLPEALDGKSTEQFFHRFLLTRSRTAVNKAPAGSAYTNWRRSIKVRTKYAKAAKWPYLR